MLDPKVAGEPIKIKSWDEPKMVRADQIRLGDLLDLEGDSIADAEPENGDLSNRMYFECELATVDHIELETPACVAIGIEGIDVFGFPVEHELRVMGFNANYWTLDMAVDRFREEPNRDHAAILREIAYEYKRDEMIGQGTFDTYMAETDPYVLEFISTRQVAARIRTGALPDYSDGGDVRCACHPGVKGEGQTEALKFWSKGMQMSCNVDPEGSPRVPALAVHQRLGIIIDTRK